MLHANPIQVLLFYPDGKRSSSAEGHIDAHGQAGGQVIPAPQPAAAPIAVPVVVPGGEGAQAEAQAPAAPAPVAAAPGQAAPPAQQQVAMVPHHAVLQVPAMPRQQQQRRDTTVSQCYLCVKLCKADMFCKIQSHSDLGLLDWDCLAGCGCSSVGVQSQGASL